MERITFKNSRNLALVGNFYPVESNAIIIMCHGFSSDKSSRGRFERLAASFNLSGFNALAFDFSGHGESEDDISTFDKQADDLKCAITYVKSRGFKKIALYGHSLGTIICLKCFSPEISTIVLSGAGTGPVKYDWNEYFTKEQMQELEEKGYITEKMTEGVRKEIIFGKQILLDFELVDQKELLKDITCPVLIIHGNNDEEELLLLENSKRAMKLLSKASRLEIIDGANHSFFEHYDTLIKLVNDWFVKYLK